MITGRRGIRKMLAWRPTTWAVRLPARVGSRPAPRAWGRIQSVEWSRETEWDRKSGGRVSETGRPGRS